MHNRISKNSKKNRLTVLKAFCVLELTGNSGEKGLFFTFDGGVICF